MEGWIKLYRQILDSDLWLEEKFTRGQAWIDLLMLATHKESSFRKRGIKIHLYRGQVGKSLDELSKRWRWSIGKVKRFLVELENETQIVINNNNVNQIITIVNYDKYQVISNAIEYADSNTGNNTNEYANSDANSTQTETFKNEKNNIPLAHAYMCEAEMNLNSCLDALLNEVFWIEQFCMNNHLAPQMFADYLKRFFVELQNRGETSKTIKDAKFHFANWFKQNKNKDDETNRKPSKSDKTRNLVASIANECESDANCLSDEEILNF